MRALDLEGKSSHAVTPMNLGTSSPCPSRSLSEIDEAESHSSEADQFDSETYDSSHYETASVGSEEPENGRMSYQDMLTDAVNCVMTEVLTDRCPEDLFALNSPSPLGDGPNQLGQDGSSTLSEELELPDTLPCFWQTSPPSLVWSRPPSREADTMSVDGFSIHSISQPHDSKTNELSSNSSVTTRHPLSLRGTHSRAWIYAADAKAWAAVVQVGRVLDVWDASSQIGKAQHSTLTDYRRRKPTKRLVVVCVNQDMTCGVPVRTYRGRGVGGLSDPQVDAHAILYAQDANPAPLPGEPPMNKRPLAAKMSSRAVSLRGGSRINFARTCILGQNSAISKVATVDRMSIKLLQAYWDRHLQMHAGD